MNLKRLRKGSLFPFFSVKNLCALCEGVARAHNHYRDQNWEEVGKKENECVKGGRAVERVSKKASEKRKEKWVNSQREIHKDRMICYWVNVLLFLWPFIVGEAFIFPFWSMLLLLYNTTHLTLAGMTCLN